MNLNLLDLLNQMKKFAMQEKGNIFSLIAYFLLSLIVLNWYFGTSLSRNYPGYDIYVVLGSFALCVLIWETSRRIRKNKKKINIAIAQVNLLNTSMEKTLDSEQKHIYGIIGLYLQSFESC